jgi:predicted TIM-barrel fold metal-dependent hydrolase
VGSVVTAQPQARAVGRTRASVIDCDIHNSPHTPTTLGKYMPARWRRHLETFGPSGHYGASYARANPNASRTDAWPPSGLMPGSDLPFLREQLLDLWDIEYGILNPGSGHMPSCGAQLNLEFGAALARAANDWQVEEWLEPEPRLRSSIVIPWDAPDLAAAEVDRCGDDPRFVQVHFHVRTSEPLGRRRYWPIYEAALRHDLPIGVHFGGAGGGPITGAGWPSFYYEDHGGCTTAFEAQVISLVCEGVFEAFPTLRFVWIEGGFAWAPSLAWTLDRSWRRLKDEVPHLRRPPSEYMREHMWFTTQPIEEPDKPEHFRWLVDQIGADRLMFSTDYPHWDFDAPDAAIPAWLDDEVKRRIRAENARAFYKLGPAPVARA